MPRPPTSLPAFLKIPLARLLLPVAGGCLALIAVLALLAPEARAADDLKLGVRQAVPKNFADLEKSLHGLASRIDKLIEIANRDPAEQKIKIYKSYTGKQLKELKGKKRIHADELVTFIIDKDKNFETVRRAAMEAIHAGGVFRGDPDLSKDIKQGPRTRLGHFCEYELRGHLRDKDLDAVGRELIHTLMLKFFPEARNMHQEIRAYHASRDKTWKSAWSIWKRFLNRR